MKIKNTFCLLALSSLVLSASALAAKSYQVTGQVLEATDSKITVMKGKEKFEIARDKDTKVTGDPKVGSKATVEYQMSAATITAKEESAGKKKAK